MFTASPPNNLPTGPDNGSVEFFTDFSTFEASLKTRVVKWQAIAIRRLNHVRGAKAIISDKLQLSDMLTSVKTPMFPLRRAWSRSAATELQTRILVENFAARMVTADI
jgi:hypothetical protein